MKNEALCKSIYLWQEPVTSYFVSLGNFPTAKIGGFVASICLGFLMAQLIEVPALRLRDHLMAQRFHAFALKTPAKALPDGSATIREHGVQVPALPLI